MRVAKLFVGLFLLLVVSTAAAKQEKTWICHVGNEAGISGETYLDDPDCVPNDQNDYFCPDAGKIDLIEIATAHKHLSNPSHTWAGQSDYLPSDVGASGVGKEDTDGNGIDDGCEASCPCFAGIEEDSPYEAYGLGTAAPCPPGSAADTQYGLSFDYVFAGFTVTLSESGDCDGNIMYACDGGPAGHHDLERVQYAVCQQGPGWEPTFPD